MRCVTSSGLLGPSGYLDPVIDPSALRRRAPAIDRSLDRLVALAAIAIAVGYLVAALAATALPVTVRIGAWLPLHLALAGGASTAIAGVVPFFTAAFAAAPPADIRLRSAAVAFVAVGTAILTAGMAGRASSVAVLGGTLFVTGVVLTGFATIRPLGRALGPSRGIVTRGYVAALALVAIGATIAILFVAGWPPLLEIWVRARPAHAWLNLFGFVSLVIATTLLHFFPTVIGARIAADRPARATVAGLAVGAPVVALGLLLGSDLVAWAGAGFSLVGGAALAAYAAARWPTRGRWTTDLDWHRFAMGGLVSAIAWFEIGLLIGAGRILQFGAQPIAWAGELVAPPLVVGWMGLAVVASATHLIPAIGPGSPAVHARQRALLGRAAVLRLLIANAGTAALAFGPPLGFGTVGQIGLVLVAAALVATAALLATAVAIGLGRERRPASA